MPSYVVTGASRGLGYGFITHLASIPGNTVIGLVRNKDATESRLDKDGVKNVHVLQADIVDHKALQTAAETTAEITGGSLDVLINNAADLSIRSAAKNLTELSPEELAEDLTGSFNVNVVGVAHTVNAFLPLIRKGQVKKVVTISTGMADVDLINKYGVAVASPYSISKAATNLLVAKYNAALGKSEGILFFALSPGLVDTSEGRSPSEEELASLQIVAPLFQRYAPHFTGPISVSDSVKAQLDVIDKATVETTGGDFISHLGNKQWL